MTDELIQDDSLIDDSLIEDGASRFNSSMDAGIGSIRQPSKAQTFMANLQARLAPVAKRLKAYGDNPPIMPSPGSLYRLATGEAESPSWMFDPTGPGVAKGLVDVPLGAAQTALKMPLSAPGIAAKGIQKLTGYDATKAMDQPINAVQAAYDKNFIPSRSGEMIGQSVPFLLAPESAANRAPAAGNKLIQLLKIGGAGAAKGAVYGSAFTPEANLKSDADYANRKKEEAGIGAVLGTGANVVGSLFSGEPLTQNVKNVKGELAQQAANLGGDEAILDALIKGKDASVAKRATAIKSILQGKAGNLPDQMQASVQTRELAEKAARNELYNLRDQAAKGVKVERYDIMKSIREGIGEAEDALDDKTLAYLKKMEERLNNGTIGDDFVSLSKFRSRLGDEIRAANSPKGSTITGSKAGSILQPIKDAVSEAMSRSAQQAGGDLAALDANARAAHSIYKNKWGDPLAQALHGQILPEGGVASYGNIPQDTLLNRFAFQGENHGIDLEKQALKAKEAMTPQGINSVKSMLFSAAMKQSGGEPSAFLKALDQPGARVFFDGDDLAKLEGFKKIMSASKTAGKSTTAGAGSLLGATIGAHFGVPAEGAAGGALAGFTGARVRGVPMPTGLASMGWAKLFFTEPGQRLLLEANRLPENSPEMRALLATVPGLSDTSKLKKLLGVNNATEAEQ